MNPIDRATCKNVIEKANTKVIVCLNLKFFVITKRWKGKKFFVSNWILVQWYGGKRMIGII